MNKIKLIDSLYKMYDIIKENMKIRRIDMNKKSKTNILTLILSPFKYFFLGCYYTMYAMIYPLILIYNKLISASYKNYSKTKQKKNKEEIKKVLNMEKASID